mmetsp:Transcript_20683/g.30750  ORF Transcript_20683/g.30750 Transcript_20683/m.30750 type:complete len:142 (-) Transcript_20683:6-431(-)
MQLASDNLSKNAQNMQETRDRLKDGLFEVAKRLNIRVRLNCPQFDVCLPNTLSIGFEKIKAPCVVHALSDRIAISAGAACHSGDECHISSTLQALNVPENFAIGTIRISTGIHTTTKQVDQALAMIEIELKKLKSNITQEK